MVGGAGRHGKSMNRQAKNTALDAPPAGVAKTTCGPSRFGGQASGLGGFLGRMGRSFAADFSTVRIHLDSSVPAVGSPAVTQGEDVYLAPVAFLPGTPQGESVLAHELAHVLQQRKGGPAPGTPAEMDAHISASAALLGRTAAPAIGAAPGHPQGYEAWEHRDLGDAYGGDQRKIRLPNGIELTYGEIVALSGDFYRSPEALLAASPEELRAVQKVMKREREQAAARTDPTTGKTVYAPSQSQVNENNADYEMATTSGNRPRASGGALLRDANTADGPHGTVVDNEHTESDAPGLGTGFLDLAGQNAAHFSPDNIRRNWLPLHRLALDLARTAWQARNPDGSPAVIAGGGAASARAGTSVPPTDAAMAQPASARAAAAMTPNRSNPAAAPTPAGTSDAGTRATGPERVEAQAWLTSAFSDHFLTDAFASGHLISGDIGRGICRQFYDANSSKIMDACILCAVREGAPPDRAVEAVAILSAALRSKAASLLLKTVHDFYNGEGITVRNALPQQWRTYGDANLGGHAETIAMAELASKASRDAVQDVLATGGTTRAEAALDYIPDMAQLSGGPWAKIEDFSKDPSVWQPVLARSLSHDPGTNPLYQMVKGNIGPMAGLKIRQGGRDVEKAATGAVDAVVDAAKATSSAPGRFYRWLDEGVRGIYGVPR